MTGTTLSADEERGTITASTNQFSLKSEVAADGQEREVIEGFLATTHRDKGNDIFTEEALQMMAKDITQDNDTVDAVFNDVDTEALKEAEVGNLDHNNNPASPFGDTRIVPAFKVVDAQVRDTPDGEKGLWIKGALNNAGLLPDTVSAVKNSIKNDFLKAFSIEFVPEKVKQVKQGNVVVRVIEAAIAKGAALTGRPMNPAAQMTDSTLKSMASEFTDETGEEEAEIKNDHSHDASTDTNDITTMTDEQEPEEGNEPESGADEVNEESGQEEQETKSFSEDVEELKSTVEEVKESNDELQEENKELKSELEDLKELQEVKSELDEVKSIVEDIELEDGPRARQEQKRFEEQETKADWKQEADKLPDGYLDTEGKSKSNMDAFAEKHSIKTEEVKNYVNRD